jgi:uncharacterized protein with FMN-binding domain
MRRALFAVSSTIAGLVLLLSFKTQTSTGTTTHAAASTPKAGTGSAGTPKSAATPSSAAKPGSTGTATSGIKTITGDAAQTRYGPVQVQITVTNGAVTTVTAVDYPQNDPRDFQINSFAIPQLDQEATAAKSTSIDFVSGATYTSQGYVQSLQSALDTAGL